MSKYKIGDYEFISLNNNTGAVSESLIINKDALEGYKTEGWNSNSLNYFVLKAGGDIILFDAGLPLTHGGKIAQRLQEAGLKPGDINIIAITHMHGDHIGGLLDAQGQPLFTNAKVFIAKEEAAHWQNNQDANAVLEAYKNQITLFKKNAKITGAVKSAPLFGHTPGHSGFIIKSNGQQVYVLGDVTHLTAQFANPEISVSYDVDPKAALKTRKNILAKVARQKNTHIAGMHIYKPGLGKLAKAEKGYTFTPAN